MQKIKFLLVLSLLAGLFFVSAPTAQAADNTIYVIANNAFPLDKIDIGVLKQVYLQGKSRLSGNWVIPLHAKKGTALREAFVKKGLMMSISEEENYWQKQKMMSGKQSPGEFSNTVRAVFSMKKALSYCFKSQYKKGTAKVLLIL